MRNKMLKKVLSLLVVCVFSISNLAWGVLEDSVTATAQVKDTITNGIDVVSVEALQASLDSSIKGVVVSSLGASVAGDVVARNTVSEVAAEINIASAAAVFNVSAPREVVAQSTRQEEVSLVISGSQAEQTEVSEVPRDEEANMPDLVLYSGTGDVAEDVVPEVMGLETSDYGPPGMEDPIDPEDLESEYGLLGEEEPVMGEGTEVATSFTSNAAPSGSSGSAVRANSEQASGGNSGNGGQMQLCGTVVDGPEAMPASYSLSDYKAFRTTIPLSEEDQFSVTITNYMADVFVAKLFNEWGGWDGLDDSNLILGCMYALEEEKHVWDTDITGRDYLEIIITPFGYVNTNGTRCWGPDNSQERIIRYDDGDEGYIPRENFQGPGGGISIPAYRPGDEY